jgi:hypothetical protein
VFPPAKVHVPTNRSSLTRRSCKSLPCEGRGLVRPLDPTLRLARIGTDDVDVQSVQRAPELGHPVAADRTGLVDAKHPVLVTVEDNRLAPGFEVGAGRMMDDRGGDLG